MTAQSHSDVYFGARENGEKVLEMSILSAFSMAEASERNKEGQQETEKNRTRTDKKKRREKNSVCAPAVCNELRD